MPRGEESPLPSDDTIAAVVTAEALRAAIAEAEARKAALCAALGQTSAKIALFRRLFRGRTDVWPRLWLNTRTGKKGYAPVCSNDWLSGVCGKPKVKCSACPNQAFLPVTDAVLQDHLQGRHVAGVYAMLPDETCWFLAADFDDAPREQSQGSAPG